MEILGIGPLEVVLVLILALIILGPQGMVEFARKLGRWIRNLVKSPLWKDITTAQREVSDLPRRLVRDAGLEDVKNSLRQTSQEANQVIRDVSHEIRNPGQEPAAGSQNPPEQPVDEQSKGGGTG